MSEESLSQGKVSYADFIEKLRTEIWPKIPGEVKSLRGQHDTFFLEGMVKVGAAVECLQTEQISRWRACSTLVRGGISAVGAPSGRIKRVYTIAGNDWEDTVYYRPTSETKLNCWARDLRVNFTIPSNCGIPALQGGWKHAETTSDITNGRARIGEWARVGHRLHVAPWLQSNESLIVEWDGVRRKWESEDIVDRGKWTTEVQIAVKSYVRWQDELHFGGDKRHAKDLEMVWQDALAEALYECEESRRTPEVEACDYTPRAATSAELEDDDTVPTAASLVFAVIGDFGDPTQTPGPQEVSDLVKSWNPKFIATVGDNQYGDPPDYEARVGAYYGDYITDSLQTARFWPAVGNHDYSTDNLQAFHTYFSYLPGNKRYYDFVKGHVHFFVYNTILSETDGVGLGSTQAQWLELKLRLSTARWKVVICQDPPYTEQATDYPGHIIMRLTFKDWGADVVMSGDSHFYQRFEIDSFPYIVNGAGGASLDAGDIEASPNDNSPFRKSQYYAKHGAQRVTVTETKFISEFFNHEGTLIDSLTLTKESV